MYRLRGGRIALLALRKVDAAGVQKRAHTVVTGLAVDVLVIVGNRIEGLKWLAVFIRPRAQKAVEHLFPGRGVNLRGLCEHAVQVKQARAHTVGQAQHRETPARSVSLADVAP